MSVALLVFSCIGCGRPATANPELVISLPILRTAEGTYVLDPEHGTREPLCRGCAEVLVERARQGELTNFPSYVLEPDYLDRAYTTGSENF